MKKTVPFVNRAYLLPAFILLSLAGCTSRSNSAADAEQVVRDARVSQRKEETRVKVAPVRADRFCLELVSNGKAEAVRKATLEFRLNDLVTKVYVKNGQRVRKGDPLVAVDERKAYLAVDEAQINLDRVIQDVRSDMMGDGIIAATIDDTVKLSPARKRNIFLQRGYRNQQKVLENALYDYRHATTKALFDGLVADLEAREYNPSSLYRSVCTLIDDSEMEVIFYVLETELHHLKPEQEVIISPYANRQLTLTGRISEINPRVNENGMVRVKAVTANPEAALADGMNVNILIRIQLENKLIIPKSAVLSRQGRKVVFVLRNGAAHWCYVTTGYENSAEVSIETGLSAGEWVIYENNLGLSHLNPVTTE